MTVLGDPQVLQVNNVVQPLVGPLGQGSQITIVNFDLVGNLYVGYSPSITAGGPDTVVIHPLGSAVIDASRRTFIVSNTAALISGQLIPGAAQWSASPADIATQISQAGIPVIDVPTQLSIILNHSVAAGATFTPAEITVSKFQSFYGKMFAAAQSGGTGSNPSVSFTMKWSIASDNFDPLIVHDWVVPITPFNFLYTYNNDMEGKVFGDSLSLTWTNNDSNPVNVTLGLFGSYRQAARNRLIGRYHWNTGTGAPDPTRGLGSDNIVEIFNPAVPITAGSSSVSDLMNLIDGPAILEGTVTFAAAGAANFDITITPLSSVVLNPITVSVRATLVAGSLTVQLPPTLIMLSRLAANIKISNNSSSASNITAANIYVVAQDQPG